MATLAFTLTIPVGCWSYTKDFPSLPVESENNTMQLPVNPDWFAIISDLERTGMTQREIAGCLGVSKSTVNSWKQYNEPRYRNGAALLEIWQKHTGR
ncbi:helix-turn-helix domain-containing protein [Salmonella enterica]|nr:helix-turn-helix domain-containing protein [Salmonella enterica]